jgi:asparagine synthase (glutamine-hydrolysing)
MCGIFGIVSKNEKVYNDTVSKIDEHKKQKIIDNLTPRGPDSVGEFHDEKCYFLSSRLKICDKDEASDQPYLSNGIVLVFNGEIYNYTELRTYLIEKGYVFSTFSDTEVIIRLYEESGLSFVDKMIGMFAFCLYDTKRKEVYIFRDRMGVKPLHYYEDENIIIFSSDIPSIYDCLDEKTRQVLPSSISSYLSYRNVIGENTFFNKIKKLIPGHYILVHRLQSTMHQYWSLNPKEISTLSDLYDSINGLNSTLHKAVFRNLPQEHEEINIFLSGGLDSSAIVYYTSDMMKNNLLRNKKINTYSIGFDTMNEFEYANLVADKFQTNHNNIVTDTDEYFESMIDLISFKGEPLNIPNEPLINIMTQRVKEMGNVVLSGEGMDELLHGYGRLFISYYNHLNDESIPFYEYFMKKYAYISEEYKKQLFQPYIWNVQTSKMNNIPQLYPESINEDDRLKTLFETTFSECSFNEVHKQDRISYTMLKLHLPALLARLDNSTMLSSVEGRVPFLDHDVIEYCFYKIDHEHKIKLLKSETSLCTLIDTPAEKISEIMDSPKFILKEMLYDKLPIDVITRKKVGFTVPLERILFEKYEVINKIFDEGYIHKLNIFNLKDLSIRFKNQTYQQYDVFTLWLLVNLEIFAQLFIFNVHITDVKSFFLVDPKYKYDKCKLIERIIIKPERQLERYIKFYIIKSLFDKYDIEYFAYGGTMLGCIRHEGFIPWDDDIDLMLLEDQCVKITNDLRLELLYAGFQIKKTPEGYKIFDFTDNQFFVDVFIARFVDASHTRIDYASSHFLEHFPGRYIERDELYPLKEYKFGFFALKGMNEPKNYFSRCNFGDYNNCAIISCLHDHENNDLLKLFLTTYNLSNLIVRDKSLLTYKDSVTYTDDWQNYFNRMKEYIPYDFIPANYIALNPDLDPKYYDDVESYIHYINHGRFENRVYTFEKVLPMDFDIRGYRCLNPEIAQYTDNQLRAHYANIGSKSNLQYNLRSLLPFDFDVDAYAYLNPDLEKMTEYQLIYHYIHIGKKENRFYTKDGYLPIDFNYKKYMKLNSDLIFTNERDAVIHYIKLGRSEQRNYK